MPHTSTKKVSGKVWAISDIHGCYSQFMALLEKIQFSDDDFLFLLGDYIDRGPDSKKILDFVIKSPSHVKCLMGNHEEMMVMAYKDPENNEDWWIGNGGDAALKSFGKSSATKIPKKYITLIEKMPLFARYKNFILSHAGVNTNSKKDMFRNTTTNRAFVLWNRNVKEDKRGKIRIVVGHTPVSLSEAKLSAKTGKIMIDGGCSMGGKLIAYCLDTDEIVSVNGISYRKR